MLAALVAHSATRAQADILREGGMTQPAMQVLWTDTPLVVDTVAGKKTAQWENSVYPIGNEDNTGGHQPPGEIFIESPHTEFSDYRRELDISRAVRTITCKSGGVRYHREYFSSHPAQVMGFRFSAGKKPADTGLYSNPNGEFRRYADLKDLVTLPQYFSQHG
jgi:hypothetical protein